MEPLGRYLGPLGKGFLPGGGPVSFGLGGFTALRWLGLSGETWT